MRRGDRREWEGRGGDGEGREGKLIETEMNCNDHNGKGSHNGTNMGTLH